MNRKERKNLAIKIAKLERIIQSSDDQKEIQKAREEMMKLCGHATDLEDMIAIDEMVQDLLEKK